MYPPDEESMLWSRKFIDLLAKGLDAGEEGIRKYRSEETDPLLTRVGVENVDEESRKSGVPFEMPRGES